MSVPIVLLGSYGMGNRNMSLDALTLLAARGLRMTPSETSLYTLNPNPKPQSLNLEP